MGNRGEERSVGEAARYKKAAGHPDRDSKSELPSSVTFGDSFSQGRSLSAGYRLCLSPIETGVSGTEGP